MKKNIFIIPLLSVILLVSCKKKFLDLLPYNQIALEVAIINEADMQAAVNGMYAQLRTANLFGRTLPLIGDLLADNVYIATVNSNRYQNEFNYIFNNNFTQSLSTYTDSYVAILRANNVINSTIATSANVSQLKGEALTIRALMYFQLVRLYGKPYTVDPNSPGVPIVLTYDPNLRPARNTVAEVYQQIEQDLSDAFELMTNTTKNSSYVTKYVARALQAKVAFYKGDYNAAKNFALDVVNNGGYTMVTLGGYSAYWNAAAPVSTKVETIFEVSFDNVSNLGTNSLAYFYDQVGYGDAICSDELYNTFTATDVRRTRMTAANRGGQSVYYVSKFPNTATAANKDDVKVIRFSEILLILAESYARTNDETNARTRLNQVAQGRDPSFAGYTSTGTALLDDIVNERRKELAFEGDRYWDLSRLNRDVIRTNLNGNYPPSTPLTLPASSHKRIWPFHQTELDANPNLQQNPGY